MDTHQIQKSMQFRLSCIGLPKPMIGPFIDLFTTWIQCSGVEWATRKMKNLKTAFIQINAGIPIDPSIRIRKNSKGEFYGVVGSMLRWSRRESKVLSSEKRFHIILQCLNCYTLIETDAPTKSQIDKFLKGVNSEHSVPKGDFKAFSQGVDAFVQSHLNGQRKPIKRDVSPIMMKPYSPNKRAPRPHGLGSVPQNQDILDEINTLSPVGNGRFRSQYRELYDAVVNCIDQPPYSPTKRWIYSVLGPVLFTDRDWDKTMYAGEVHLLQEPGLKMRAIASPYRLHQMALKPLGDAIYDLVKTLPWDCTFNQESAIPHVQAALNTGALVHSVDLTGATDYFPLELQLEALKQIFGDVLDIKLLEEIARLPFKCKELGEIRWKTGQPLGLYPSFAMFTLTHGLLLFTLNGNKHNGDFFVLGDDVVILNDELAKTYKSWLERNKCPFAPEKSLTSNALAEFAGKVITGRSVFPAYKWRRVSDDNFLSICRNFGSSRSRSLLTKRQKQIFDIVSELLEPFGLGFNPKGLPYGEIYRQTERVLAQIEQSYVRSLVDLSERANELSYSNAHGYSINLEKFKEASDTLDERVVKVFSQTVVKRWDLIIHMNDLPAVLDIQGLPPMVYTATRVTELQKYSRILDKLF